MKRSKDPVEYRGVLDLQMFGDPASPGPEETGQPGEGGGKETMPPAEGEKGGGEAKSWKDELPEDLRNDPNLEPIKDIPGLAKSFVNVQKMVGNRIPLPKDEADDEAWSEVFDKLGRPESPEKYAIEVPEGYPTNEEFITSMRKAAHSAGLNQKQLNVLSSAYLEQEKAQLEAYQAQSLEQAKKASDALLKDLGGEEKLTEAYKVVERAVEVYGGEALKDELDSVLIERDGEKIRLGNSPHLFKAFYDLGKGLGEDGLPSDGGGPAGRNATEQIAELRADKNFMERYNSGDPIARKKMSELYTQQAMEEERSRGMMVNIGGNMATATVKWNQKK